MKVLIAGDWHSELHEEALAGACRALGHTVEKFAWHGYFGDDPSSRLQNKYLWGPRVRRLNADLLAQARRTRPELVFVYRGTHVLAETLDALHAGRAGTQVVGYNNDDPFSPRQPRWLWRHFLACVPRYDAVFAYRPRNLEEFRHTGARRVALLPPWFMPERNHPVSLDALDRETYESDVVFVGHYERDQRLAWLEAIVEAGHRLRLFGPGYDWDPVIAKSSRLKHLAPVRLVWGEDYNKALCGAKIALCFFSRLNRDTYTRRCFEIPATGTFMLSEYSDDLARWFRPGTDADYFRDTPELLARLRHYLADAEARRRIAAAGMARAWAGGHDVVSRVRDLLTWIFSESSAHAGAR